MVILQKIYLPPLSLLRRKKEEGRRKKEEGRRKKEEGRRNEPQRHKGHKG
jgi:hypothetical protein